MYSNLLRAWRLTSPSLLLLPDRQCFTRKGNNHNWIWHNSIFPQVILTAEETVSCNLRQPSSCCQGRLPSPAASAAASQGQPHCAHIWPLSAGPMCPDRAAKRLWWSAVRQRSLTNPKNPGKSHTDRAQRPARRVTKHKDEASPATHILHPTMATSTTSRGYKHGAWQTIHSCRLGASFYF